MQINEKGGKPVVLPVLLWDSSAGWYGLLGLQTLLGLVYGGGGRFAVCSVVGTLKFLNR